MGDGGGHRQFRGAAEVGPGARRTRQRPGHDRVVEARDGEVRDAGGREQQSQAVGRPRRGHDHIAWPAPIELDRSTISAGARGTGTVVRMTVRALADRYGRVATDLRVSLTDRCNLRCTYCMPAEGLAWLPSPQLLTDDEVVRLVRVAVERLGVTEVRFTGGEPLLRPGLVEDRGRRGRACAPAADLADHQRHRPGPPRRRVARRRARPGQRLAGHARPGPVRRTDPAATARRRPRRAGRRRRGRPASGEDQFGADARDQRRRGRAAAAVRPGPRLRAALHRADAARRRPHLEPGRDGHGRGDPGPAARGVRPARPTRRTAAPRRPRPGWSTAGRRGSA